MAGVEFASPHRSRGIAASTPRESRVPYSAEWRSVYNRQSSSRSPISATLKLDALLSPAPAHCRTASLHFLCSRGSSAVPTARLTALLVPVRCAASIESYTPGVGTCSACTIPIRYNHSSLVCVFRRCRYVNDYVNDFIYFPIVYCTNRTGLLRGYRSEP